MNLRLLLIANTTSTGGTQITAVALPLLLIQNFQISAFLLSLFAAARYVPFIVLGVPIGAYVGAKDSPKQTMLLADGLRLLALALVPVLWLLDLLSIPVLFVIVLAVASLRVVHDLSSGLFVVRSFDRKNWLTANSRIDSLFSVMESVGPTIAGAVAAAIGAVWAFVLDVISYAVSFFSVRRLQGSSDIADRAAEEPKPKASRSAVRFLLGHPVLRRITAAAALQNAALMTLQGVILLILVQERQLSALVAGVVVAAMGIGGAVGAVHAPRLLARFQPAAVTVAAALAAAVAPLVLLLSGLPYLWLAYVAGYLLLGWGIQVVGVITRRYRQEVVPAESFAKIQGLYSALLMGSLPVGALLGGVLAQWIAPVAAVVGASALFAAATALLLILLRGRDGHRMEFT